MAETAAGLSTQASGFITDHPEAIVVQAVLGMPVKGVGVSLEVNSRAGQAAADVDHLLGETRCKRELECDGSGSCSRADLPSAIKTASAGQIHRVAHLDAYVLKRTHQVQHGGYGM